MSGEDAYLLARLLLGAVYAYAAGVALRGWRPGRAGLARGAMAAALVAGALLSTLDAVLAEDAASPVVLTGLSWTWMVFDFAVPVLSMHVLWLVEERDAALDAVLELAATDPLTGLPNRRGFEARAGAALGAARRAGRPCAVAVLDLDHFKAVNDAHGHAAGDAVLRGLAQALRAGIRAGDVPGRLGGEEFAILLPGVTADEATALAERLRLALPSAVPHPAGGDARVTASIGIAAVPPGRPARALAVALARADRALYAAKRGGRDRVERA